MTRAPKDVPQLLCEVTQIPELSNLVEDIIKKERGGVLSCTC